MRVTSISNAASFKARIDSQSPLVSGNWDYLENPAQKQAAGTEPKKGSFWKKAFWTVVALAAVAGALAWGKNTNAVKDVMATGSGFKELTGIGNKFKYLVGKGGDYVQRFWNASGGKLVDMIRNGKAAKAAEEAAEAVGEAAEKA